MSVVCGTPRGTECALHNTAHVSWFANRYTRVMYLCHIVLLRKIHIFAMRKNMFIYIRDSARYVTRSSRDRRADYEDLIVRLWVHKANTRRQFTNYYYLESGLQGYPTNVCLNIFKFTHLKLTNALDAILKSTTQFRNAKRKSINAANTNHQQSVRYITLSLLRTNIVLKTAHFVLRPPVSKPITSLASLLFFPVLSHKHTSSFFSYFVSTFQNYSPPQSPNNGI